MEDIQAILEETGSMPVNGHQLFYRLWRPKDSKKIKLLIHINHGMSEHSGRYTHFAQLCAQKGYMVIAQDHPGHGKSVNLPEELGHIADINSWKLLLKGIKSVQEMNVQLYDCLPCILFGHSMGSFASLDFMEQLHKNVFPVIGVILSGSTQNPWYLNKSLQIVAGLERWRQGGKGKSRLINLLTFKSFNKRFSPNRTDADWLSSDQKSVDHYLKDPLCGKQSSNQTWYDFAKGLNTIFNKRNLKKVPSQIPFLLISGDQDPLSDQGGFHRLEHSLQKAGVHSLTAKTFPHGRHELLNEINHAEVEMLLFNWIENILKNNPNQLIQPD